MLSKKGQKQIDSFQAGGNRQGLNFGQIKSFKIPLPPLPEQRTIALSLSDTDALIAACDRAITKKRNIKQGAMQQLLTGKMRLPGFSGEWEQGYKQTEIGMIPNDWECGKLYTLTNLPVQNGIFNDPVKKGRGCKLINVSDLYSTIPINCANLELLDVSKDELARIWCCTR